MKDTIRGQSGSLHGKEEVEVKKAEEKLREQEKTGGS